MNALDRIHIFGASGSGTSTLGSEISRRYGYAHLDTDTFFWEPTDPPYHQVREVSARQQMLAEAIAREPRWVLTGSLCGWGDIFIPHFQLAVFVLIPHDTRMARLIARERQRYGAEALSPFGKMRKHHREFIAWAEAYDTADESMRSLRLHEKWLASLPCLSTRLEGQLTIEEQLLRLRDLLG